MRKIQQFNINMISKSMIDYTSDNLIFNYLNLKKYLYEIYKKGIDNVNILLLISLGKEYYEGDNFKKIMLDLKNLASNLSVNFDGKNIKFKINKISLDVGDVLNRHTWVYRCCEKYLLDNNLSEEKDIPDEIIKKIETESYEFGKNEGFNWFNKNIDAINQILPKDKKPLKLVKLGNNITEIYPGDKNLPKIEYVCYEYWLEHKEYKTTKDALHSLINLPNSIINRTYDHEVNYYIERLKNRNEGPKFEKIFAKHSKNYLIDETMPSALRHRYSDNNLEFYYLGKETKHSLVFKGKKAQNNDIIKYHTENELHGITNRNYTTIQDKTSQ